MAATTVDLRTLVKDKIAADKTAENFVYNDFDGPTETYLPVSKLEELNEKGKVWVIALAKDDTIITRGRSFQSEIPIQIALQRLVRDTDVATLDELMELAEQLRISVKDAIPDSSPFAWLRNEALRDANGTPYHFTGLRERSTFESYFTAIFQVHEQ